MATLNSGEAGYRTYGYNDTGEYHPGEKDRYAHLRPDEKPSGDIVEAVPNPPKGLCDNILRGFGLELLDRTQEPIEVAPDFVATLALPDPAMPAQPDSPVHVQSI